jgi:uncharacterized protein
MRVRFPRNLWRLDSFAALLVRLIQGFCRRGMAAVMALLFAVAVPMWGRASDDPATVTLSAADMDACTGLYRGKKEPDVVDSVYRMGDKLYFEGERSAQMELLAESKDHFFVAGSTLRFTCDRGDDGVVKSLTYGYVGESGGGATLLRFSTEGMKLNHFRTYTKIEVMMPMRDGKRLHAVILRPEGSEKTGEALPFLMERTPYGTDHDDSTEVNESKPELAASGYIFVFADIRGRFESEGKFVMNRPIVAHKTDSDVDEITDTHDTIDWLLKNVPNNNGRVGVLGVSYPGFLAMMAGIDAHPAVKAISPQAPMTDVWIGDDFFHNGAFRMSYGFDYVQEMEAQKNDRVVDMKVDMYNFFLNHVNFEGAASATGMKDLPTAQAFIKQPTYTKFWREMAVQPKLTKVEVPTMEVGGWWDQEDMWGTQEEYRALQPHDAKQEVFLVLGPWNHGGWSSTTRHLGELNFGAATGDQYRKRFEAPFFEKYLKDRSGFDLEDTASFRTGVNKWERYAAWPPVKDVKATNFYLTADGGLNETAPAGDGKVSYVADPAKPVPYRRRPIGSTYGQGSKWYTWLVEDQRFVTDRKDLVKFETPVLEHEVTVTGEVKADLFASTTGSDSDWVVKLIDVYPGDAPDGMAGFQLMVAEEIFRGRYVNSFEKAEALTPGAVTEFKWSLNGVDHTFLKGHRMMVEVQSSWFPLYDRNPQTFVKNIMTARAKAYKAQTQTIYESARYPSHLDLPIMGFEAAPQ